MREDLYLAEGGDDAPLAGLAVIAYVHGLGPDRDRSRPTRIRRSDRAAARLRRERAVARGCQWLEVHRDADAPSFDDGRGWQDAARVHRRAVTP